MRKRAALSSQEEILEMNSRLQRVAQCLALSSFIVFAVAAARAEVESDVVAVGKKVSFEYSVSVEGKKNILDSNIGKPPLTYTQGSGNVLPALQTALLGMKIGETRDVTLKSEQAYGAFDPKAIIEVKKSLIPENLQEKGQMLVGPGPSGDVRRFKVLEIKENTIVLDFNHPLAGKSIMFKVKIVNIE